MKARPLTKAVAEALAALVLERAREHLQRSRNQIGMAEVTFMRVAVEDIAATLLGAVSGSDPELELRRVLGDGHRPVGAFGPSLRIAAEQQAACQRHARAFARAAKRPRRPAPRPPRRFIDHTHPED